MTAGTAVPQGTSAALLVTGAAPESASKPTAQVPPILTWGQASRKMQHRFVTQVSLPRLPA